MRGETPPALPNARVDRRVLRTRQALRKALMELIEEKGYDAVTVEEITQRASLGRATFYLHYKDKEDLLLEQFSELARDRFRLLASIPFEGWDREDMPPYTPLLLVFEHAAENAGLYRGILHGESVVRVTGRLQEIIIQAIRELVREDDPPGGLTLNAPVELIASYLAGALVGSIAWWLEEPDPLSPEEMTLQFQRLFIPGAARVFGLRGQQP